MSQILGKTHLSLRATPVVVRKHISDSRENPQLTTTPRCTLSGPPEHKLKRIFVEWLGNKKGAETRSLNINATVSQRPRDWLNKSSSKEFPCGTGLTWEPGLNQWILTRIKMSSEGCSITENSSLHLERGQQSKSDLISYILAVTVCVPVCLSDST